LKGGDMFDLVWFALMAVFWGSILCLFFLLLLLIVV